MRRLADLDLLRFIHPTLTWSARAGSTAQRSGSGVGLVSAVVSRPDHQWMVVYAMALAETMPDEAVRDMLERFPLPKRNGPP